MHTCIHACMLVHSAILATWAPGLCCVCMRQSECACMYTCMYACVHACIHIYSYTPTFIYIGLRAALLQFSWQVCLHANSHAARTCTFTRGGGSACGLLLLNTAKGERCLHFTCAYLHAHTHTRAYIQHAYTTLPGEGALCCSLYRMHSDRSVPAGVASAPIPVEDRASSYSAPVPGSMCLHLPMHACVHACVYHLLISRPWPSRYVSMHACM